MSKGRRGGIRIVAGSSRGRRLIVPKVADVRPTSEMVREAIFDVLGPIGGLGVLDLFAGSGALGIEALSRGASRCVFVESERQVVDVLRQNIAFLGYESACEVLVGPYQTASRSLAATGRQFELFFVDPPYRMLAEVEMALRPLVGDLLSPEGVLVIEGPRLQEVAFGLPIVFEREYGETRVTMVRSKGSDL